MFKFHHLKRFLAAGVMMAVVGFGGYACGKDGDVTPPAVVEQTVSLWHYQYLRNNCETTAQFYRGAYVTAADTTIQHNDKMYWYNFHWSDTTVHLTLTPDGHDRWDKVDLAGAYGYIRRFLHDDDIGVWPWYIEEWKECEPAHGVLTVIEREDDD